MSQRAIHELPVLILTDEELLNEYGRTFSCANGNGLGDALVRRNAATMRELLRRGFESEPPRWTRVPVQTASLLETS